MLEVHCAVLSMAVDDNAHAGYIGSARPERAGLTGGPAHAAPQEQAQQHAQQHKNGV